MVYCQVNEGSYSSGPEQTSLSQNHLDELSGNGLDEVGRATEAPRGGGRCQPVSHEFLPPAINNGGYLPCHRWEYRTEMSCEAQVLFILSSPLDLVVGQGRASRADTAIHCLLYIARLIENYDVKISYRPLNAALPLSCRWHRLADRPAIVSAKRPDLLGGEHDRALVPDHSSEPRN
ncbi:hypothetical protein J6590_001803 [Homalodisca vitripennis]|nr:hypothetical protein J6590_001803 [Homalodisca vitripennis]